jgi:carbon monoxide dehydrogenase subunit G
VEIENTFRVPVAPEEAWKLLNDVPRVIPCMPGAELNEVVDENTFKVTMHVKLGPAAFQFAGDVTRDESDAEAYTTTMTAKARDTKGRGMANARIQSSMEAAEGGTLVKIVTDLRLQGTIATMGRGVVQPVASQMVSQFADCIAKQLQAVPAPSPAAEGEQPAAPPQPAPVQPATAQPVKPVGGFGLLWRSLLGIFRR